MIGTHPRPTLPQFKQWAKDCAPAAKAVLMARAFAQVERERVDAYILPIFARYTFVDGLSRRGDHRGEKIDRPDQLYLSTDEALVAQYFEECDQAHRAHGFKGPKGHCPALTAEHLVIKTEQALIDLAKPLIGIDDVYGDDRKRYLEILIGACARHIKGGL
jgi:hypothetical protein